MEVDKLTEDEVVSQRLSTFRLTKTVIFIVYLSQIQFWVSLSSSLRSLCYHLDFVIGSRERVGWRATVLFNQYNDTS